MRIDISDPFDRNLRMPDPSTGNVHHRPGAGLTTGNLHEQVMDTPLRTDPNITIGVLDGL